MRKQIMLSIIFYLLEQVKGAQIKKLKLIKFNKSLKKKSKKSCHSNIVNCTINIKISDF